MQGGLIPRFLEMLLTHRLIEEVPPKFEEHIENPYWLLPIAIQLLRSRWVGFGEHIHAAESYSEVIHKLAERTEEEWKPTEVSSVTLGGEDGRGAIRFEDGGEQHEWTFEQRMYGNYLSHGFLAHLAHFTEDRLPGDFVRVPVVDPADEFLYLPRPAAVEFKGKVLALNGDELTDLVMRCLSRGLFDQRLLLEFLAQFNLRRLNEPDSVGALPLNLAVQAALEQKEGALDLVVWLREQGADPNMQDRAGVSALTLAEGHVKLVSLEGSPVAARAREAAPTGVWAR